MIKHRDPLPYRLDMPKDDEIESFPRIEYRRVIGGLLIFLALAIITAALTGCTSSGDFQKLLEDVKENCHTTVDAQLATTISGIGGSGHFQQECWPTGAGPVPKVAAPAQ